MNNIQEKCLRLITNDYDSNFNEILESSHELSIHKSCINHLMIEVYKYLHGLSAELMTASLLFGKSYNISKIRLCGSENPRSLRFKVDGIAFRASQLW